MTKFDELNLSYKIEDKSYQSYEWIYSYNIESHLCDTLDVDINSAIWKPYIKIKFTQDNIEMEIVDSKDSLSWGSNYIARIFCDERMVEDDILYHIEYFFQCVKSFKEFLNFDIFKSGSANQLSKEKIRRFKIKNLLDQ